ENYKDVDDPSIYVSFPVLEGDYSFIAWTTTPWTLLSNQALMVGPDIDYVKISSDGKKYLLAEARVGDLFSEFEVLERLKGSALEGVRYRQPFAYFEDKRSEGS